MPIVYIVLIDARYEQHAHTYSTLILVPQTFHMYNMHGLPNVELFIWRLLYMYFCYSTHRVSSILLGVLLMMVSIVYSRSLCV